MSSAWIIEQHKPSCVVTYLKYIFLLLKYSCYGLLACDMVSFDIRVPTLQRNLSRPASEKLLQVTYILKMELVCSSKKMLAIICDNVKHKPLYLLREWDLWHRQIHEMGKNIQPFQFYGMFLHTLQLQMVAFQQGIHNTEHPDSTSQPFHHGAYPEPFLVEGNPRYHTMCLSWKKIPYW